MAFLAIIDPVMISPPPPPPSHFGGCFSSEEGRERASAAFDRCQRWLARARSEERNVEARSTGKDYLTVLLVGHDVGVVRVNRLHVQHEIFERRQVPERCLGQHVLAARHPQLYVAVPPVLPEEQAVLGLGHELRRVVRQQHLFVPQLGRPEQRARHRQVQKHDGPVDAYELVVQRGVGH